MNRAPSAPTPAAASPRTRVAWILSGVLAAAALSLAVRSAPNSRAPSSAARPTPEPATANALPAAAASADPPLEARAAEERTETAQHSALHAQRQRADGLRTLLRARRAAPAPPARSTGDTPSRPRQTGSALAAGPAGAADAPSMPAPEGTGNQAQRPLGKYIQQTVRQQFVPLASSCYDELLQKEPAAKGRLVLELEVVGDSSVGGVVNDVELGEGTSFGESDFTTCVRESLLSTVFDAPPEGQQSVTISYPLELAP